MKTSIFYFMLIAAISGCLTTKETPLLNEPEMMAWGNLTGIRVEGQLIKFGTSLRAVNSDWSDFTETLKEQLSQQHRFVRSGNMQTVTGRLDSLYFTEIVESKGPGIATINVQFTSRADTNIAGAFFSMALPSPDYAGGTVQLINPSSPADAEIILTPTNADEPQELVRTTASGARFIAPHSQLDVLFNTPTDIIIRNESRDNIPHYQVYLAVLSGDAHVGQSAQNTFTLTATGDIDHNPVALALNASNPGRVFDGLGGNFRLQNPQADAPVIQYNLDNMRVAWGRVEMPWFFWQPEEDVVFITDTKPDSLHPKVRAAMEMARTLAQRGAPVIVSAWSAPDWAIMGDSRDAFRPQPGGLRGYALNPKKMNQIYASIGAYLMYLKDNYGVEAVLFSFNESDLGINVRQTSEEHAEFIKGLGAYLAMQGLATKMLLGDTSDARPIDFIKPAMEDPEAVKYIGAVSFHSWRGCTDEMLVKWNVAARLLHVPLLVGEGSTDAAAWTYPTIFSEQSFALYEINLYTRILALAEPQSILQWQLTADYSILAGGGVLGKEEEPLWPTQRFWNLKQLASTPTGAFSLPITCKNPEVTCAAFGDIAKGDYAVHIVNNGASRPATLTGIPNGVNVLRRYVTDSVRGMDEEGRVSVVHGQAQFTLDAASYTTLFSAH